MTRLTNTFRLISFSVVKSVNLYEAKTHLSSLVDEAAGGEKILIAKNGEPRAMLVPIPPAKRVRKPAKALQIRYIAPEFDAPDEELNRLFEGDD